MKLGWKALNKLSWKPNYVKEENQHWWDELGRRPNAKYFNNWQLWKDGLHLANKPN